VQVECGVFPISKVLNKGMLDFQLTACSGKVHGPIVEDYINGRSMCPCSFQVFLCLFKIFMHRL
jgi:hypothetical protein